MRGSRLWCLERVDETGQVFGISFTSAVALELEMSPPDAEGTEELKRRWSRHVTGGGRWWMGDDGWFLLVGRRTRRTET